MNNQEQQPSPCPECAGTRVTIGYGAELFLGYKTGGIVHTYPFWAVCCTSCGHMTQYADQKFITDALQYTSQQRQKEDEKIARQRLKEEVKLAQEAERQQKEKQKIAQKVERQMKDIGF